MIGRQWTRLALLSIAAVLLVTGGVVATSDPPGSSGSPTPQIVTVAPNPVAHGDAGEFVVLDLPGQTNLSGWWLDDGESVLRLPAVTVTGRVAVTTDPDAALTELPTVQGLGRFALANAGETVRLGYDSETVDAVTYEHAPEGEWYVLGETGWRWRPAGARETPVTSVANVSARTFVLPDAPEPIRETLATATERVLLAGYTYESATVTDILCLHHGRGVETRVLLEGEPVGGLSALTATQLDRLDACGVNVTVLGGDHARYSFHHAKYAVVDDAALVLSENWKPSGTGGQMNRGWGVVVRSPGVADALATLFERDTSWLDARAWKTARPSDPTEPDDVGPTGDYPPRFAPTEIDLERVDLLVAPDTAAGGVRDLLRGAEDAIHVQQMAIGSRDHPFVKESIKAARRGVRVRILLSSVSYLARENGEIVEWLNGVATNQSLPLEARLVDPRGRFGKVHVKGVIADDAVVVGSLNWNAHATRENREVVLVLHGVDAAAYYDRVFAADWRGGVWRLPGIATVVIMAGGLLGIVVTRRWQFAPETHISPSRGDSGGGGVVPPPEAPTIGPASDTGRPVETDRTKVDSSRVQRR